MWSSFRNIEWWGTGSFVPYTTVLVSVNFENFINKELKNNL